MGELLANLLAGGVLVAVGNSLHIHWSLLAVFSVFWIVVCIGDAVDRGSRKQRYR